MARYFATNPQVVRLSVSAVVWRAAGVRELLLMQRSDNRHWGLPGGYVEPGESVLAATEREVREETGYAIEVGRLIGVDTLPEPFVPIHSVRIADAVGRTDETQVR